MRETDQNQELLDDIVEDFTQRLRHGERPAIGEYSNRHPELRNEIEELLTSVAMIEELKTQPESQSDSIKQQMREICRLDRIGDYRIVRELGRGGMGIVFEAVHESLGRRVAIKVMPNRTFDDEKYLERFKREAHAAANLHHTNIVSVFGMGHAGDHRYYVMEFVDGMSLSEILAEINRMSTGATQHDNSMETLADQEVPTSNEPRNGKQSQIDQKRLPPIRTTFKSCKERFRWAAKLGMQIADGLAYAHGMGMLHRDIKPANLLVDRFETVWLTDFGLVKNISNQSITKSGDIIGTPQYMAPEAFEGRYDERSEIYCLGLTLYELVTLRPAYENASTPELIRRITTTSPIPPRKLDPRIPRDLNRIIQKSISREASYRYLTAVDMRNDLQAFLEDRPISARKISMTENLYRWGRRNPLAASLAVLTGFMILCVAITSNVFLSISNSRNKELQHINTVLDIEKRNAEYESNRANKNLELLGDWLDHVFIDLVLKDVPAEADVSLDGFDQLKGISTTVNETDAEFLSRMLKFYELFVGTTNEAAYSTGSNEAGGDSGSEKKFEKAIAQGNAAQISPDVRARSYRRIGNIYHVSGELEKAIEAYDQAIGVYQSLLKSQEMSFPLRVKLARVLNEKGQAIEMQGLGNSRQKAVQQYSQAEQYLKDRLAMDDVAVKMNGTELQIELAKTLALIGAPHYSRRPQFPQNFRDRFDERLRQRPRQPGDESLESLSRIMVWFGPRSPRMDHVGPRRHGPQNRLSEQSMEALQEALQIVNQLLTDDFQSNVHSDVRLLKATILTRMATLNLAMHPADKVPMARNARNSRKFEEAMNEKRRRSQQLRSEALEIVTKLQQTRSTDDEASPELEDKQAQYQYAEALIRATPIGVPTRQAIAELKVARKLLENLTEEYDRNYEYRKLLSEVSFRLGRIYRNNKDLVNAERNFRQSYESSTQLIQEAPRNIQIQQAAFASLLQIATLLMEQDDHAGAEQLVQDSIEMIGQLPFSKRRTPRYVKMLMAGRHFALAEIYRESGNRQAAMESIRRAKEISGKGRFPVNAKNRPGRRRLANPPD